ncbi:hypothetical protein FWJ25_09560 [Marinobacter salinexigens]|uniref:Uncharacterized protein n=1 Tax=Marinobacter salinexigens TaxID=2919747 RepID=A0A5B0VKG0_9GAMM|nr:hypothetical protein [Marinobacter salinexigens]KAA1174461.1 hypothetical protein FWJ25_09560 [Marinobacter salinexigens]
MAIIIDQLVEIFQGFDMSHLASDLVGFVSKKHLVESKLPSQRKSMSLPGKKKPKETQYYYENARALAALAKDRGEREQSPVIGVLFRDADGTASAGRGDWQDKRNSMIAGFKAENFDLGVAMMPKPKSEAWLLCASQKSRYQNCARLEKESGNDASPNSLKQQLAAALDGADNRAEINAMLYKKVIDVERIDMPSFNLFKDDLMSVVKCALTAESPLKGEL